VGTLKKNVLYERLKEGVLKGFEDKTKSNKNKEAREFIFKRL
jgi:hypothetical protein